MLNKDFINKYTQIFKQDADAFFAGLMREKSRHIRLASARSADYLKELSEQDISASPIAIPNVYSITDNAEKLTETIGFQTGGFYIMNPSSVFTANILTSLMPDYPYILDVSSAPGGKTCAIADLLKNRCAIIANEPSPKRLKSLQFNIEKYGSYSVRTVSMDGRSLHKVFDGFFDGILLDAPCSNENKIGRNKTVNAEWTQELTERMAKLQKEIAHSAFHSLKEGGVMVYSTCTFAIEENEEVVKYLLDSFDCELIDINKGQYTKGISGNGDIDGRIIRFLPHLDEYDGFFIAALRKKGEPSTGGSFIRLKPDKDVQTFFTEFPEYTEIYEKGGSRYLTTRMDRSINFKSNGIMLFKREGELASQAFWQLADFVKDELKTQTDYSGALRYLKGFDIDMPADYHGGAVYYKDIPVGMSKPVQGMLKNKLDRYFLYGKNIEW
ncbi:RsmB/NOP family class I SAM-dependent RNA methyltransferase [Seleniivibrio woodruffii]|uniref:NOL1/NOP2/sun family putative RNA methylase n=1 Tax=Seleniivibrio woodruffii TaxID=1078050 RepID=A0A4R1KB73_9BACT|nr:RsmB/NOP family class I SAM-dependent RNA methyltransferase [Seleniivibrio woodruffii]TCK61798.1 NOL1/NOP2/sun family putative RNA methylase [Seleniivibrio woodruffii]TVZ35087.1 16S rRNA (cytosine1407-C5)-methyltransferase [Seleniivibrio woodruffii]